MEKKSQDPFISILKDNLNNSSNYRNLPPSNNNIVINRNFNELLNEEELSKKIGKMEAILNYYEVKLNNEFNERKLLEKRYEEKIESLTIDINDIRENVNNFSKLFTENFSKIKNNILENVDNKNTSINKIILESAKRINTLEDVILNINNNNNNNNNNNYQKLNLNNDNIITSKSANNSIFFSTERESSYTKPNISMINNGKIEILSKKVNQLETFISKKANYPGRDEEINTGIAKINHMEKKFELFLENYNKDMNIIKNTLKQNLKNCENLSAGYDVLNQKYDNLYKNFNDTNININKYNYQTTLLLNETQKKMEEYTDYFNNTKLELNKMEDDLNNEYALLKQVITEKINEFDKNINQFESKINFDTAEFKKNIEDKQEKFINYIQSENNHYLCDAKKVENSIEEQCGVIKKENIELNLKINEIKNSFFHNLNEIEQYFNKKYQSLCKVVNLKE